MTIWTEILRNPEDATMKWIILIIIVIAVAVWLARGRRQRTAADPEAKTVDKTNYYVKPSDEGAKPDRPVEGDDKR